MMIAFLFACLFIAHRIACIASLLIWLGFGWGLSQMTTMTKQICKRNWNKNEKHWSCCYCCLRISTRRIMFNKEQGRGGWASVLSLSLSVKHSKFTCHFSTVIIYSNSASTTHLSIKETLPLPWKQPWFSWVNKRKEEKQAWEVHLILLYWSLFRVSAGEED